MEKSRIHFDSRLTDFIVLWLYISFNYILTLDQDDINWYTKQLLLFYIFVTLYEFIKYIKQHFNFHTLYTHCVVYNLYGTYIQKENASLFLLFSNGNGR